MFKYPCGLICIAKALGTGKQRITVHDKRAISIDAKPGSLRFADCPAPGKASGTFPAHAELIRFDNFPSMER